jgi:hypothetical protein
MSSLKRVNFDRKESILRRKDTSAANGEMVFWQCAKAALRSRNKEYIIRTLVELSMIIGSEKSKATMQGKKGEDCKAFMQQKRSGRNQTHADSLVSQAEIRYLRLWNDKKMPFAAS